LYSLLFSLGSEAVPLQRSPVSIVRSIRQVSLARDWLRARGGRALPSIASFEPNERAGDTLDLSIFRVAAQADGAAYVCLKAGDRVRSIHGETMVDRALHECLAPPMAEAAAPIWNACVTMRLPVYLIVPVNDPEGRPVTIEQIFLPYSHGDTEPDFIVTSLHACSTEGRFVSDGLLRVPGDAPPHWAVALDPDLRQLPSEGPAAIIAEGIAWPDTSRTEDV
jgi:hypothetical protein